MSKELPASLHLKVITQQKLLVDIKVKAVSLPSLEGYIGVLPGHRPLFTALGKGWITYRLDQKEEKFPVEGGFADVSAEEVLVFTTLSQEEEGLHEG